MIIMKERQRETKRDKEITQYYLFLLLQTNQWLCELTRFGRRNNNDPDISGDILRNWVLVFWKPIFFFLFFWLGVFI